MVDLNTQDLQKRLSRIEGQIKGIRDMLANGRECEDVIIQLSAVNAGVTQVARFILTQHIENCVVDGIRSGDERNTVESLKKVIEQFAKLK